MMSRKAENPAGNLIIERERAINNIFACYYI